MRVRRERTLRSPHARLAVWLRLSRFRSDWKIYERTGGAQWQA